MMNKITHFFDWQYRQLFATIRHLRYRVRWKNTFTDPHITIPVPTHNIKYKLIGLNLNNTVGTYILSGEWDQNIASPDLVYPNERPEKPMLVPIDQWSYYRGTRDNFQKDIPWEQTELYEYLENRYKNQDEIKKEIKQFEKVYDNIRSQGYKTQRELIVEGKVESYESRSLIGHDEVCVAIGRDGSIYQMGKGNHRMAIAKVLELETIPVRVLVRHKKWQKKRHKIYNDSGDYSEDNLSHPDLNQLIK